MEVRAEHLLGRKIVAADGVCIGRIEELEARPDGDVLKVTAILVGKRGAAERFVGGAAQSPVFAFFRPRKGREIFSVPPEKVDLSDPRHPRLVCRLSEVNG